jgi:type I restriction-modification system DNA methylase subunit
MINIRKLEAELWESADLLRQGSKLTSNQYCMPVLALLFLRYAYVGVAEQEDDGVDFHERMNEIHAELAKLNQEANVLMDEIQKAWETLKTA